MENKAIKPRTAIRPLHFAKTTIMAFLVFCAFSANAFAAENTTAATIEGMTESQKKLFFEESLSISPRVDSSSVSSVSTTGFRYSPFVSSVSGRSVSQSQNWDAFKGANQIPKSEFFRLLGNEELYNQCLDIEKEVEKKHKKGKGLVIGGSILSVAGITMLLCSIGRTDNTLLYTGAGTLALGFIPIGIGIANLEFKNDVSISFAYACSMMDEYNSKLALNIKKSF